MNLVVEGWWSRLLPAADTPFSFCWLMARENVIFHMMLYTYVNFSHDVVHLREF